MAKINSTTLVITLSKLVKNTDTDSAVLDPQVEAQIGAIIGELAGPEILVEVEHA